MKTMAKTDNMIRIVYKTIAQYKRYVPVCVSFEERMGAHTEFCWAIVKAAAAEIRSARKSKNKIMNSHACPRDAACKWRGSSIVVKKTKGQEKRQCHALIRCGFLIKHKRKNIQSQHMRSKHG